VARACRGPGRHGGGQMLDLDAEGKKLDERALEDIHRRKTAS
jgi:geranylgeranyl pyrophosphate synthase